MMTLPADMDSCLHRHTKFLLQHMVPDGVYVYLSGARLLQAEDRDRYTCAHDSYDKNHALLTAVAGQGSKGFEAFLEALDTTQQGDIAERLKTTLREKNANAALTNTASLDKIKNVGADVATSPRTHPHHPQNAHVVAPSCSSSSASSPQYIVGPKDAAGFAPSAGRSDASPPFSTRLSRSRSITRTPLTPPLTETELDDHLARLKTLLRKISTTHSDRYCRKEAQDLLGELGQAGEAMVDRLRELSEENKDKEQELRRAKFMVRGMETEIQRMKATTTTTTTMDPTPLREDSMSATEPARNSTPQKSKLCVIL